MIQCGHVSVSEERLDEFIEIYERVEGERIPREEAREIANHLVAPYRLVLSSPPEQSSHTSPVEPSTPPSTRRRSEHRPRS
jgi:hypothetical protein